MKLSGLRKAIHQIDKIRYRPVMVAKIARGYLRSLVLRQPTLRVCEFSITPDCQSRCVFCYASQFRQEGKDILSLEEIRSTWKQAKQLGAFSALILGGEPLLHPQFLDIIRILEPRKHLVTFATNAIALTEDIVIELKRLGVFLINISLNSLRPDLNDQLRGFTGHHEKVMEAIRICKKHGIDVSLPVATSKKHLHETKEIIAYAERNGLQVVVNLMCAMGRAEKKRDELFDEAFWTELRRMYDANPNLRSDFDVNLTLRIGCPAGFEKVHVAPYGDVTGCSMNPASFGNVRELPLKEIVRKMREFHHFAKRHPSCIVAVDEEFIGDYMDGASQFGRTPYPVELNSAYERDRRLRSVKGGP